MDQERNVLDYIYVLVKWRRMIATSVLSVAVVTAGITLIVSERWTADTTVLPHEEELGRLEMSMLMNAAVPGNIGGLLGQSPPGERLVAILKSRTVLGAMVDRFDLIADYGSTNRDLAMETLAEKIETELGNGGTLRLQVEASSAQLAADLANALVVELGAVIGQKKKRLAGVDRAFLEARLAEVQGLIESKTERVQKLQDDYGIVDLETQTKAIVSVVQHIVQELTLKEVELAVAQGVLHPDHEDRLLLEMEVAELRRHLDQVAGEYERQAGPQAEAAFAALGPPLQELPQLGIEFARLELELKMTEHTLTFLAAQLEDAKLRQAKPTASVQILDRATPPEFRSAPRRTLTVLAAALLSLLFSVVMAFVGVSLGRLSDRHQEKLDEIRALRSS